MDSFCLQDWVTLRGAASVATLTQSEPDWLELAPYQDIVGWLEVKEMTPSSGVSIPTLLYQTAPTKDDALFFNMAPQTQVLLGVTTTPMLKGPAGFPPVARWLRWQISMSGGLAWDLTFRIWIAANRIGGRAPISQAASLAELEGGGYWTGYGQVPPTSSQGAPPTGQLRPQRPRAVSSSLKTQVR